jgi:hypothetical protein
MRTHPPADLADEPRSSGLGGFGEAGEIEPGVADEQDGESSNVPPAPADPADAPVSDGPLNPA